MPKFTAYVTGDPGKFASPTLARKGIWGSYEFHGEADDMEAASVFVKEWAVAHGYQKGTTLVSIILFPVGNKIYPVLECFKAGKKYRWPITSIDSLNSIYGQG